VIPRAGSEIRKLIFDFRYRGDSEGVAQTLGFKAIAENAQPVTNFG